MFILAATLVRGKRGKTLSHLKSPNSNTRLQQQGVRANSMQCERGLTESELINVLRMSLFSHVVRFA